MLEVGVLKELFEHSARCAAVGCAPASSAESAPHAALSWVLCAALLGAEHPVEHVLVLCVKSRNAGSESESVVGIEGDKLEGVPVAAPGAYVVVRPVSVVEVHFGEHILGEAVDVQLGLKLFVLLVVFAGVVGARNFVDQLLVIAGRGAVGAARFKVRARNLDHVDGLGIDSVVRLDKASVQAFAQVVNTEVFAVIEHHHLAAALVVNVGAFHQACHHGVADVVGPETVAVVAQVETLDLLGFGACREHRVFQDLVAVVVVVHLDRDTLLGLVAAIVADNRDACVDFPGLFGGGASVFEEFHVYGELVFAPEVG